MEPRGLRERLACKLEQLSIWSLAALLITLPFWRHRVLFHRPGDPVFFEFHDITLYTNDLLWWSALGAWLLSRLVHPAPGRLRLGPWFLSGPLVGLVLLGAISIPFAVDPLYAGYQTLRLVLLLALYLMAVNLRPSPEATAWPLAGGLIIQAVVALPQFVLGRSLGLKRLGEVTVEAAWPGTSVVMVGEQRWLRVYGLAQHPNLLGGCLMAMLLIVAGFYLTQSGWRRFPLLAALGLGLTTLLLTFSRAAWLGTLVGGLAMMGLLLWTRRKNWPAGETRSLALLVSLSLAIIAFFVAFNWPLLQPRLGLTSQGAEIRSMDARKMQIGAAWTLIGMRPVLGVGLGNFSTALYRLARETVLEYPVYQPAHNVVLLSTAELGPLGGMLWVACLVTPWLAILLRRKSLGFSPWWAGLCGAMAALTVVGLLDSYVWSSHQGRLSLWLLWGFWAAEWTRQETRTKTQNASGKSYSEQASSLAL